MKYDTPFASRFKALRERIGVSQNEMAEKLGISQQSVSFYEKGERLPDFYVLNRICNETNCSIKYLFGYQDAMSDQNEALCNDLGLSEEALYAIRILNSNEKTILDRLLKLTSFGALISCIRYAVTCFDLYTEPVTRSFEWDHRAYMCNRIFDDVMDELYDQCIRSLEPEDQVNYRKAIEEELSKRQNHGTWDKKVKVPIATYEKDPQDHLTKFKFFKAMMQNIQAEEN